MIDVGDKPTTRRRAVARARVKVSDEVLARLADGTMPKGDVLATARVAGIMAAKSTPQILPLCHPLLLTHVAVDLEIDRAGGLRAGHDGGRDHAPDRGRDGGAVRRRRRRAVRARHVQVARSRRWSIDDICLVSKSGGKSGDWERPA